MAESPRKSAASKEKLVGALVFLVVGVLLASMLAPAFKRARESARRSQCLSNLHGIGFAIKQYAVDNVDQFPIETNDVARYFSMLTNGNHLAPGRIYTCPSESPPRSGSPLVSSNISYGVVVFADNSANPSGAGSDMPLIFERGVIGAGPSQPVARLIGAGWTPGAPHGTDGGCVVYVGGQAAFKKVLFDVGLTNDPGITNAIALFPR